LVKQAEALQHLLLLIRRELAQALNAILDAALLRRRQASKAIALERAPPLLGRQPQQALDETRFLRGATVYSRLSRRLFRTSELFVCPIRLPIRLALGLRQRAPFGLRRSGWACRSGRRQ
jgi:hypothetical protein